MSIKLLLDMMPRYDASLDGSARLWCDVKRKKSSTNTMSGTYEYNAYMIHEIIHPLQLALRQEVDFERGPEVVDSFRR